MGYPGDRYDQNVTRDLPDTAIEMGCTDEWTTQKHTAPSTFQVRGLKHINDYFDVDRKFRNQIQCNYKT